MKTEEIVRVLTFAAGNSDDCVFRECVTTAISRLQAAEKPCEKCEEWERAWEFARVNLGNNTGMHSTVRTVMDRYDPRRKPSPAKRFDWEMGV